MNKRFSLILFAVFSFIGIGLTIGNGALSLQISPDILSLFRWIAIATAIIYCLYRKSLTAWILVSMLLGVELGYDFPEVAKPLKVLSDIFLRLIKTIIAPLIFSTLVVGIAGHSSLKQVCRMGLKAILYFEVVTTFALVIGLAAINFTQAGKGAVFQARMFRT